MAQPKTQPTDQSVDAYLSALDNPKKETDARHILAMMEEATGAPPCMWGSGIIGFGSYTYRYASGRTGDWFLAGFAPRKSNITLYILPGFSTYGALLEQLGKHKTGKSCLYIRKLADVDEDVLRALIRDSVADMRARHEAPSPS